MALHPEIAKQLRAAMRDGMIMAAAMADDLADKMADGTIPQMDTDKALRYFSAMVVAVANEGTKP